MHVCPRCHKDVDDDRICWCWKCHKVVVAEMHAIKEVVYQNAPDNPAEKPKLQWNPKPASSVTMRQVQAILNDFRRRNIRCRGSGYYPLDDSGPWADIALRNWEDSG